MKTGHPTGLGQLRSLILCAVVWCFAPHVRANDIYCGGADNSLRSSDLLSMPSLKIAADAPVGTTLWKRTGIPFSASCLRSVAGGWYGANAALHRQNLAIAGAGLTFSLTYRGNAGDTPAVIDTGTLVDSAFTAKTVSGSVDLELKKTGPTSTSGSVGAGSLYAFSIDDPGGSASYHTFNIANLSNISFTSYTCNIDSGSRSITVPLGDIRVDKFTGVGSTSPNKTFNIGLTCSQPAGTYTVALNFTATQDASKAPGVLALAGSTSAASGVGIQLLANGNPVELGKDIAIGTSAATSFSVPMIARYYQTAQTVKPGAANGQATFVVTYK